MVPIVLTLGLLAGPVATEAVAPEDAADEDVEPQTITLRKQKASVAVLPGSALDVTFEMEVVNDLPLDIRSVDVGVVFGASPEALEHADPDVLYQKGEGRAEAIGGPVMVVLEERSLRVEGKSSAALAFSRNLEGTGNKAPPAPAHFVTHVLGYDVAAPTADLLLKLLDTQVPADEVAAVRAFALAGSANQKKAARSYWRANPSVVDRLAVVVDEAVPNPATHQQLMHWAYVVGALGVAERSDVLERLSKQQLDSLDEAFQVLRLARLGSSTLQAPLAFAVPPEASTFGAWVQAALEMSRGDFRDTPQSPSDPLAGATELEPDPQTPPPAAPTPQQWPLAVGALLAAVAILGAYVGLRSKPTGSQND